MTTNRSLGESADTWWVTGQSSMLKAWEHSDPPSIPNDLIQRVRRVGLLSPSVHTYLFQKTEEVDFIAPAVRWLYLTYLITWQKQTEDKLRLEEEVQH